jgi:2-polyprenyl-6-methoxyphenol hydroxylase-like FAD-dependent oxidoreductase
VEKGDGVTARFDNGAAEHGDLLVGADGLHSTVRNLLSPGTRPSYVGYVAWRGLVEEASLSAAGDTAMNPPVSRRGVLAAGALVVAFSWGRRWWRLACRAA